MKHAMIIGTGYGDEGKGLMTAWACNQVERPLVVRFNGGPQAGHTVVKGEHTHTFSSFGSGTLQGAPTFFSKYCCLNPMSWVPERKALLDMGYDPESIVDPMCMIVTPYDVAFNQQRASETGHGSCGMGVGSTFERNEGPIKLFKIDLLNMGGFVRKLGQVKQYYIDKGIRFEILEKVEKIIPDYLAMCTILLQNVRTSPFDELIADGMKNAEPWDVVFEGAQGLLLDQDHGFFPHVTRSYTTARNAMEMMNLANLSLDELTVHYVTRAYSTRHGNGPMTAERLFKDMGLKPFEGETNKNNTWQGPLRYGFLDIETFIWAVAVNVNYTTTTPRRTLTITCMDQLIDPRRIMVAVQGGERIVPITPEDLANVGDLFDETYLSFSPEHEKLIPLSEVKMPEEEVMEEMKF
jgi:adenylosuccinate synthase